MMNIDNDGCNDDDSGGGGDDDDDDGDVDNI